MFAHRVPFLELAATAGRSMFVMGGGLFQESRNEGISFAQTPGLQLNEVVLGVFGRAQRLYPVRIVFLAVLSSHFHLLVDVDDAGRLSDFMEYLCSNLAREVNRLTGWEGPVFSRRYQAILVSPEEAAQIERLAYVLSQGCVSNCTSFQDLVPGMLAERLRVVRCGQSVGISYR